MEKKVWIRNTLTPFIFLSCILLLTGCGSKIKYGVAKIDSTPQGAEVVNLKDSSHFGVTPVRVSFSGEADTSEFVTVQLRKNGYRDRISTFWINRRHETVEAAKNDEIDIHIELEKIAK